MKKVSMKLVRSAGETDISSALKSGEAIYVEDFKGLNEVLLAVRKVANALAAAGLSGKDAEPAYTGTKIVQESGPIKNWKVGVAHFPEEMTFTVFPAFPCKGYHVDAKTGEEVEGAANDEIAQAVVEEATLLVEQNGLAVIETDVTEGFPTISVAQVKFDGSNLKKFLARMKASQVSISVG